MIFRISEGHISQRRASGRRSCPGRVGRRREPDSLGSADPGTVQSGPHLVMRCLRLSRGAIAHGSPPAVHTCRNKSATIVNDILSATKFFFRDLSIRTPPIAVRARQLGVADFCNASSDWSTVRNVGLRFSQMSAYIFVVSATNVGYICR